MTATTNATQQVDGLRGTMDEIDAELRKLLVRRRQVSHSIRRAKLGTGLPDTDIAREKSVLAAYRTVLGDYHGSVIGHAVLAFSKDHE